jgi:hypothetical protein
MNDSATPILLFFGAAITLVGIGIHLSSSKQSPENSTELQSPSVKTNMFILKLLAFSICITLIQFSIHIFSSNASINAIANSFEGEIREKNK